MDSAPVFGETALIRVADIAIRPEHRKPIAANVSGIADSIKELGLLHPIGVTPGEAGKYILVFGGNRLAAHKKLKLDVIKATVLDLDAADVDGAMHAENLFRDSLSTKDRLNSVAAWAKFYKGRHPESYGKEAKSIRVKQGMSAVSADAAPPPVDEASPPDEGRASLAQPSEPTPSIPKAPREALAKITGKSSRSAHRDLKIAETLTEEQRAALADRNTPILAMEQIAGIADEEKRHKAVSLIASGMDHDTAIVVAKAPPNATLEIVENPNADGFKPEAELSDEEWFNAYCGETAARLPYVATYKIDAILWRKLSPARHKFKADAKRHLAQSKVGLKGPFHYMASRLINVAHPKDWMPCGPCGGTGACGSTSKCTTCRGNAFAVTLA